MISPLEQRLRRMRSRVLVRAWSYRQRRHAQGVWFRLRRALADARAAYALSHEAARQLAAEGHPIQPVGRELQPPKLIIVVPSERMTRVASARPLAVRLDAELLAAECLALVPFE